MRKQWSTPSGAGSVRLNLRTWVLPIPLDVENIDLVIGASTDRWLRYFGWLSRWFSHRIVCKEVEQDVDVWAYKGYLDIPALAKGDGPIPQYRRWARQVYAPRDEAADEPNQAAHG